MIHIQNNFNLNDWLQIYNYSKCKFDYPRNTNWAQFMLKLCGNCVGYTCAFRVEIVCLLTKYTYFAQKLYTILNKMGVVSGACHSLPEAYTHKIMRISCGARVIFKRIYCGNHEKIMWRHWANHVETIRIIQLQL